MTGHGHSDEGHGDHRDGHDHEGQDQESHDQEGNDHIRIESPDHERLSSHGHARGGRLAGFFIGLVRSHSHDHADSFDDELMVSRAGTRALAISLSGLLVTAVVQLIVFGVSGSVGLLADTIHNFADAATALPIGLALVVARRAPTRRYTYGYGRAEDLSGLVVVVVIAASAVAAGWESINRLLHPGPVTDLGWVAAAGVVGFVGNELAARYRIRVGRQIGSAALAADGYHARSDGFTSLAVLAGAIDVALGVPRADPIVGLAITVAILVVLRGAARDVYRRLMDARRSRTDRPGRARSSSRQRCTPRRPRAGSVGRPPTVGGIEPDRRPASAGL